MERGGGSPPKKRRNSGERKPNKPLCKYGAKCYRKNPAHFEEYEHPERSIETNEASVSIPSNLLSGAGESHIKRTSNKSAERYGLYLFRVAGLSYDGQPTITLREILDPVNGELIESVQFNFMFDVDWLVEQYPEPFRSLPLLLVYGAAGGQPPDSSNYPNIHRLGAHIRYPFGSHHTKMMFLKYRDGLKIVIHTANMIPDDWNLRTQGIWISPKLPLATDASNTDSATKFRSDLITYLEGYGAGATRLRTWIDDLKLYDFREIKVYLVASVSGSHGGPALHQFGHLRLKMLLQSRKFNPPPSWLTVGQFSSIGSLGAQPNKWLTTEFAGSLAGRGSCGELRLVFPCVEDVRNSLEGYLAGGCLPYTQFTADKQPWLREFLCRWQAGGHSRAAPHIKSYTRISPDNKLAAWFLLTSANLSKAAWGNLIKSRTQLMIRSYELGVLFLPECFQSHKRECQLRNGTFTG
ncbi:unnamed protein product [Calicophoron daubneyi]|uniref:PBZ-type domain-containing protein n=1 Tax=Calicophoron daubneyi TaxID=300641 RepID=A0AAV2TV80_CALDB